MRLSSGFQKTIVKIFSPACSRLNFFLVSETSIEAIFSVL